MAGHSKFANIKHRKNAQDIKRGKVFTRISKEIIVAVKTSSGNTDPSSNPSLRSAIVAAKAVNMPNDKIKNAINRGKGNDEADNLVAIRYEGYGIAGSALIIETLTNKQESYSGRGTCHPQ